MPHGGPSFNLLHKVDLSSHGLGLHQFDYDPANDAERLEVDRRMAELNRLAGRVKKPLPVQPSAAPMLSDTIKVFMAETAKSKSQATVEKYEHSLGCFVALTGDMPITAVSQTHLGQFKQKVRKLPCHASKLPATRGKAVMELVAVEHQHCIADRTVNTHLRNVVSFMTWAQAHYSGVQHLTSKKLAIPIKTRADEDREAFSDSDLVALFSGERFNRECAKQPYKKFLLLLGVFTGARIEEICQLDLKKVIYQDDGIWVFDFNDLDDKNLKTMASKRKIPVHPKLIELGVLDYFASVKATEHTRPFPKWTPYRGKYSKNASKWFGRYCDACGVIDKRKVFHSFRHTVLDRMKQEGVDEGKAAAVAGQTYHGISYARYGKQYPPKALQDAVSKIHFTCLEALPLP